MHEWKEKFDRVQMVEAAARYGVNAEDITKIGGFENLIYQFELDERKRILRVSHSSRREESQIRIELDWLVHLANRGARVSPPILSANNVFLEKLKSDRGDYLLTAFEKAPGEHISKHHAGWGTELFEEWGFITGQMHAGAKDYVRPDGIPYRTTDDYLFGDVSRLTVDEMSIYRKYRQCMDHIAALPKNKDSFGISHRDLHHGNFYVNNGNIHAFDFDDCGYDFFIHDIAIAVYYASVFPSWETPISNQEQIKEFSDAFLADFMKGYERANHLDKAWLNQLPVFMEKRRCELCMLLVKEWGPGHPNKAERDWLQWNIACIKNDGF